MKVEVNQWMHAVDIHLAVGQDEPISDTYTQQGGL
jgi:hypothetical protein